MPLLEIPNLDFIRQKDARLGEALQTLASAIATLSDQTGSVPSGDPTPPSAPSAINVTAAGGIFDIAITDNNPTVSGVAPDYFLEYSTTPGFQQPVVIHLGPARNYRATLGNQTLYWRAFSQTGRASQPSSATYFGSAATPTPIAGGGAISGPNLLPSSGSGTAPTNGLQGGSGYGRLPVRNIRKPGLL